MDAKNFEYLSKKVGRYEQLQDIKVNLSCMQEKLVKDENLKIVVGDEEFKKIVLNECHSDENSHNNVKDEINDLFREIKDNLIDTIGMALVEIEDKIKEL